MSSHPIVSALTVRLTSPLPPPPPPPLFLLGTRCHPDQTTSSEIQGWLADAGLERAWYGHVAGPILGWTVPPMEDMGNLILRAALSAYGFRSRVGVLYHTRVVSLKKKLCPPLNRSTLAATATRAMWSRPTGSSGPSKMGVAFDARKLMNDDGRDVGSRVCRRTNASSRQLS